MQTETRKEITPEMYTRFDLYGDDDNGARYSLHVIHLDHGGYRVRWNVSRPGRTTLDAVNGASTPPWGRGWGATFTTESDAMAFAESKLETLRSWAAKQGTT